MNTTPGAAQGPTEDRSLSIGDLSARTGVSTATLRMWEQRHGFPSPERLVSGHRRYSAADVSAVRRVVQRRDAGVRLDVAIAEATAQSRPQSPSVFAELRRAHPELAVHRLRKSTLLAVSWAIEDEMAAKATDAYVFGAFQLEQYFDRAHHRWQELARVAHATYVLADFPDNGPGIDPGDGATPIRVPLPAKAPMRREWAVVCDSADLNVALTAWELPGQHGRRDRDRIFEAVWTLDPQAVREASRVCAGIVAEVDPVAAEPLLRELASDPSPGGTDLAAATTLFNRVVAYTDRFGGE